MSFAKKYNHSTPRFAYDTAGKDFVKMSELEIGKVYKVNAVWINKKSKFGDCPVIGSDKFMVGIPKHMLNDVCNILADDEAVADISNGKVGFSVRTYEKNGGLFFTISWEDINE